MASFDELRAKALDLAQAGAAKANELTDIAKLNIANSSEEDLGKLYYAERGMAPEGAYVALCEKITAAKQRIEENKAKIAEMRAAGNIDDIPDYSGYAPGPETDVAAEEPVVSQEVEEPKVVEPLADEKNKD